MSSTSFGVKGGSSSSTAAISRSAWPAGGAVGNPTTYPVALRLRPNGTATRVPSFASAASDAGTRYVNVPRTAAATATSTSTAAECSSAHPPRPLLSRHDQRDPPPLERHAARRRPPAEPRLLARPHRAQAARRVRELRVPRRGRRAPRPQRGGAA